MSSQVRNNRNRSHMIELAAATIFRDDGRPELKSHTHYEKDGLNIQKIAFNKKKSCTEKKRNLIDPL